MAYLMVAAQWLLAAVFAVAVGSKLTRSRFREFVTATGQMLPRRWSRWRWQTAAIVVATEVAAVVCLVVPATTLVGLALVAGLSTSFALATGARLRRGDRSPCRCFGASSTPLGPLHLVRNLLLVGLALTGIATSRLISQSLDPAWALTAAVLGVVTAALLVRLEDLVALFAPMPGVSTRK